MDETRLASVQRVPLGYSRLVQLGSDSNVSTGMHNPLAHTPERKRVEPVRDEEIIAKTTNSPRHIESLIELHTTHRKRRRVGRHLDQGISLFADATAVTPFGRLEGAPPPREPPENTGTPRHVFPSSIRPEKNQTKTQNARAQSAAVDKLPSGTTISMYTKYSSFFLPC